MNNVVQLRNELCSVFDRLKSADIETDVAKEMVNTAGKIIKSVQLELVYASLRKERPVIVFLGGDQAPEQRADGGGHGGSGG